MTNRERYLEKLRNPKWQKKRLQVMERAGFRCETCFDTKKTLNVHHGYYESGYDPWDYDIDTLWCLCEDCHESTASELRDLHFQMAKIHPFRFYKLMKFLVKNQAPQHGGKVIER